MPNIMPSEHSEYLREIVQGRTRKEIAELMNSKFGTDYSIHKITAYIKNHKLNTGLDGRFKPGHIPFNKGRKGVVQGGIETQFKPGHVPANYRPVGSERVNVDGYIEVKVSDPKKWRMKHVIVWECVNGKVPKGHVLIFADGDRLNVSLDNLILVSRATLVRLNQSHMIYDDADLTRTGVAIAEIKTKIGQRKRG